MNHSNRLNLPSIILLPLAAGLLFWMVNTNDFSEGQRVSLDQINGAENAPAPESYEILINSTATACTYEILDHDDQDLFAIAAGGTVKFTVKGDQAFVNVSTAKNNVNIPGIAAQDDNGMSQVASSFVRGSRVVKVRDRMNGISTTHKVTIQCDRDGMLVDAEAMTMGSMIDSQTSAGNHGGPSDLVESVEQPKKAEGGPDMKVEDE